MDGAWAAKTLTGVGGSVGGMIDAIVKHKKYTSTDGTKVYEPKGDLKLPEKFSNPEDVDKAAVAKRKREAKKALLAEDEG